MTDICEKLVRFAGKVCISTDAEVEASIAIEALRAENAKLREALKPFADKAELYSEWAGTARDAVWFPISDLHAARAAMGETDAE